MKMILLIIKFKVNTKECKEKVKNYNSEVTIIITCKLNPENSLLTGGSFGRQFTNMGLFYNHILNIND